MRGWIIALTAALLVALGAVAQEAEPKKPAILPDLKRERPDLKRIQAETHNPASQYYYPRLMEEFQRNDTLMKIDKYRHLYLGMMFQEDYNPYRTDANTETHASALTSPTVTRQECDSIISYAQRALDNNPFDLRQMMLMINALRVKGQKNLADIWQYKLNYLLMAIVSTGTGLSPEEAWVVIEPQHEYVLLNMLNYRVDDHAFVEPCYEFITVTDARGNPRGGYYFDIRTMLEEYYRKNPEDIDTEEP